MAIESPRPELDQLLRMGANAARKGNRSAARALFLALTREYPDDARVWVGLAAVAADTAEQRHALEQALARDPQHPTARQRLAELDAAPPPDQHATVVLPETILDRVDVEAPAAAPTEVEAPAVAPAEQEGAPAVAPAEQEGASRFPMLNLIMSGLILLLLAAVGLLVGRALLSDPGPPPAPTSPLLADPSPAPALTATLLQPSSAAPAPTLAPTAAAAPVAPSATPDPAGLPLGTLLEVDGWSATLLRPEYALVLDGAVGELQPAGRFVLTMLAVSNNSSVPRRIPADLFVLADAQGRRYTPTPGASSAFLGAYGRGQYGDLALEDEIEPLSGMRTIPVLFDVPLDATELTLTISGAGSAGWPIDGAPQPPAGP